MDRHDAILLIGPTGSGKTPLGELLDGAGLWDRRCRHFDFGRLLRRVAAGDDRPAGLSAEDVAFVESVLRTGALLEDEHFPIAAKVLRAFLFGHGLGRDDLVVLNGLPRHVGQAEDVDAILNVRAVIELACTPEVAAARVRSNAGGDRAGRGDDHEQLVREKLALFRRRTAGLVKWYRRRGAHVVVIDVAADTSAADLHTILQRQRPLGEARGGDPC